MHDFTVTGAAVCNVTNLTAVTKCNEIATFLQRSRRWAWHAIPKWTFGFLSASRPDVDFPKIMCGQNFSFPYCKHRLKQVKAVKSCCGNHRPIRTCGTVAVNLRHNFLVPSICGGESPDLHFSLLQNWNSCVAYGDAVHSPKLWRSVNSLENILRQGLFLR